MNKSASKSRPAKVARQIDEPEVGDHTGVLERFDSVAVSLRAAREVRNREIHLPPVSVYRWWARRTEAVFGGILDAFFSNRSGSGLVVDPFSGGGVIPLAAVIRGHSVYAQDLNPWATQGLAGMLRKAWRGCYGCRAQAKSINLSGSFRRQRRRYCAPPMPPLFLAVSRRRSRIPSGSPRRSVPSVASGAACFPMQWFRSSPAKSEAVRKRSLVVPVGTCSTERSGR